MKQNNSYKELVYNKNSTLPHKTIHYKVRHVILITKFGKILHKHCYRAIVIRHSENKNVM